MDRHRGDRFSDRPGDGGGRNPRMPSRWSSGSPTGQYNRHPRGGGDGFTGPARHHPYRAPNQEFRDEGPVFGDGGGPGGLGHFPPMGGGQKRGFHGRDGSPVHHAFEVSSIEIDVTAIEAAATRGCISDYAGGSQIAKLFVGAVPRTITEEDVRPLFDQHGDVIEVALIKDKRTGEQQGCCFIKYATSEEADRAIRALHNKYTLPGAPSPMQVRYADGERENLGAVEHKLYVASLNLHATEKDVEEVFSPYGHVEDVYLMKDDMKQSRGRGFVKFSNREMAESALNALNGIYVMKGCNQPLIVRFANPKRARPGEQRDGPAFGGPGFGARSETSPVIRFGHDHIVECLAKAKYDKRGMVTGPASHFDEPIGASRLSNVWYQRNPQSMGPSSQAVKHEFTGHPEGKDVLNSAGFGNQRVGGPTNGPLASFAVTSSSSLQQNLDPSVPEIHPASGQQLSALQKPFLPQQDMMPSLQQHQHISASQTQGQMVQVPFQQLGQFLPQSVSLPSFSQAPSLQQLPGLGGQLSASQPGAQQSNQTGFQTPLGLQQQGLSDVCNQQQQQQLSSSTISPQLMHQPAQQLPSQFPQMLLQQQAQALQSSFQSSQQAILQLQQQLLHMQQSSQQQVSQTVKQRSTWTGQQSTSSIPVSVPTVVIPSTASMTSANPVTMVATLSCSWTEHTSPEGYKYYYNSVTNESKWEKPEELTLFEQQQQQKKLLLLQQQQQQLPIQQLQSPSHAQLQTQIHPSQQLPQTPDIQGQMHLRQQAQLQYQASGAAGHQNVQDSRYAQPQTVNSVIDPARVQQGIQAVQEWAWKNKPSGS